MSASSDNRPNSHFLVRSEELAHLAVGVPLLWKPSSVRAGASPWRFVIGPESDAMQTFFYLCFYLSDLASDYNWSEGELSGK